MPAETQYKICPKCQTKTGLVAPYCLTCGRQFRTQFVQSPSDVSTTPQPKNKFLYFVIGSIGLAVVFGLFFVALKSKSPRTIPAQYQGQWVLADEMYEEVPISYIDIQNTNKYLESRGRNDKFAMNELRSSGRVFLVPIRTSCVVLAVDEHTQIAQIRILDGVHNGDIGVLYTHWIQKMDAPGHYKRADGEPTAADKINQNMNQINQRIYQH